MGSKQELRKCIYELVGTMPKSDIVKAFKTKNISRSQVYRAIADCENGVPVEYKQKSGRRPILNTRTVKKLVDSSKDRIGISKRKLARKFGVSPMTVHRILKKKMMWYTEKERKCQNIVTNSWKRSQECAVHYD